jgi:hypothetical protein
VSARLPALTLLVVVAAAAVAERPPAPVAPAPPATTTTCWFQPRWFESLRHGVFDYCRRHLRYRPGELECYYVGQEICWVWLPASAEWVQTHRDGPATVFPCPYGPEPPVCPRLAGL